MNIPLLTAVRDQILSIPERFEMETWSSDTSQLLAPCQTTGCIRGWAHSIASRQPVVAVADTITAERGLGLTNRQEGDLFVYQNWPPAFRDRYADARRAGDPCAAARAAADRIDHMMATGE